MIKPFGAIRKKIEKQREKLISAIGRLRSEDPFANEDRSIIVEPGSDAASLFGHDQVVILSNRMKDDLKEIEKALVKIKKGTYGKCEKCSKKIDLSRLKVKPQAIYCLECEGEVETRGK